MTVKIAASSFGKDKGRRNGMTDLERDLIKKVKTHQGYAVVWYDVKEIKTLSDSDEETAVVRILGIEPVDGAHAEDVQHIYTLRYDNRTGNHPAFQTNEDLEDGSDFLRNGSGVYVGNRDGQRPADTSDDWDPADDVADTDE